MEKNNSDSTSRRGGNRPRIIIEREYVGAAKLNDVLDPFMEMNTRKNVADMCYDDMKKEQHQTA